MNGWATCTRCGSQLPTKPERVERKRAKMRNGNRRINTWGTFRCRCGRVSRRLIAKREAWR